MLMSISSFCEANNCFSYLFGKPTALKFFSMDDDILENVKQSRFLLFINEINGCEFISARRNFFGGSRFIRRVLIRGVPA